jgi:site-specific DNA recombinase
MKAVGYCRVSTQAQGEDGCSLEMQRQRIEAFCMMNGYELAGMFVETASGGKLVNRPEAQNAIAMACRCNGVLVVFALSRLARSVRDCLAISERLAKSGSHLSSLSEKLDTASPFGNMIFTILAALAQLEREEIKSRTGSAMAHLRKCNRRISTRIPLGFDLAPDGVMLIPNAREQRLIEEIATMHRSGMTLVGIARALRDRGTPTKMGGIWHASTIKAILDRARKLAA